MTDQILTRIETARLLRLSVRSLARLEVAGELPPRVMITRRTIGYRQSAIEGWLNARTRRGAAGAVAP